MDRKIKENIVQLGQSISPNKDRAFDVLSQFSKQVVTVEQENRLYNKQPWYMHVVKLIMYPFMDAKGILTAVKVLGIIVILGFIAVFFTTTTAGKNIVKNNIAQVTATPTATPTPTTLVADTAVDEIITQIDATAAEIDAVQKDLDELDAALSMKTIDSLSLQLDGIK